MAKIITFAVQKGGSSKTTSAGITAYLLSKQYKVLAIDLDSQANLSELLLQKDVDELYGKTIFEALQKQDTHGYIQKVTDSLDVIPSDDQLATFSRWLYTKYKGNHSLVLERTLESINDNYDFIIIDTPPALGDITINALCASDGIVVMFETSKFCYSAIGRFLSTAKIAQQKVNPKLKILGILCSMIDNRRTDNKQCLELAREEYKGFIFDTVIQRKATTGRLPLYGFIDNPEIESAVEQFKPFIKELLKRGKS
jgi:chromosome partitioning protein